MKPNPVSMHSWMHEFAKPGRVRFCGRGIESTGSGSLVGRDNSGHLKYSKMDGNGIQMDLGKCPESMVVHFTFMPMVYMFMFHIVNVYKNTLLTGPSSQSERGRPPPPNADFGRRRPNASPSLDERRTFRRIPGSHLDKVQKLNAWLSEHVSELRLFVSPQLQIPSSS